DPEAAYRLATYAEGRGYTVLPEDIKATFGLGWWKYSPDVAARLLENNGFSRDADGKWLLPDGTPWKFSLVTAAEPSHPEARNLFAAMHEWKKFGIDVELVALPPGAVVVRDGLYDGCSAWPAKEPWGGHPDMFRTFDPWNSVYLEPVLGEPHYGHLSRWTDPRMDRVIAELKLTDWGDIDRMVELGTEGFKIAIEEMPTIPVFTHPGLILWSTYYWTGWATSEDPHTFPSIWWPNLKFMMPFLEPTGR
ncbi:unnamed protein product, partial [marine sediment metagenome]